MQMGWCEFCLLKYWHSHPKWTSLPPFSKLLTPRLDFRSNTFGQVAPNSFVTCVLHLSGFPHVPGESALLLRKRVLAQHILLPQKGTQNRYGVLLLAGFKAFSMSHKFSSSRSSYWSRFKLSADIYASPTTTMYVCSSSLLTTTAYLYSSAVSRILTSFIARNLTLYWGFTGQSVEIILSKWTGWLPQESDECWDCKDIICLAMNQGECTDVETTYDLCSVTVIMQIRIHAMYNQSKT